MKRFTVLLVCCVLLVSMSMPAFAAEPKGSSLGEDIFVWICVSINNPHAWLVVQNNSFVDIRVGDAWISAGETVTVGGFQTSKTAGAAYINRETQYNISDAIALKTTIDPLNYYILPDAIEIAKDKFYYPSTQSEAVKAYTCVDFALDVWHAIGGTSLTISSRPRSVLALWNLINGRTHEAAPVVSPKSYVMI